MIVPRDVRPSHVACCADGGGGCSLEDVDAWDDVDACCRALQPTMMVPWRSCSENTARAQGTTTLASRLSPLDFPPCSHP